MSPLQDIPRLHANAKKDVKSRLFFKSMLEEEQSSRSLSLFSLSTATHVVLLSQYVLTEVHGW